MIVVAVVAVRVARASHDSGTVKLKGNCKNSTSEGCVVEYNPSA